MKNLQTQAEQLTRKYLDDALGLFRNFTMPTFKISFAMRGRSAGQICFRRGVMGNYDIRYNNTLLQENGDTFLNRTVPHEAAHIVAREVYGDRIRAHGREWKSVMVAFGIDPDEVTRCHSYDTANSARTMQRYSVFCNCMTHEITATRFNKMLRGNIYTCRKCKTPLLMHRDITKTTPPPVKTLPKIMKPKTEFRAGSRKQQVFDYFIKTSATREQVMMHCETLGLKASTGANWYSAFLAKVK